MLDQAEFIEWLESKNPTDFVTGHCRIRGVCPLEAFLFDAYPAFTNIALYPSFTRFEGQGVVKNYLNPDWANEFVHWVDFRMPDEKKTWAQITVQDCLNYLKGA